MNKPTHDTRNGLLCALAVAAALWASYPVAEMGFIDDWSYIKTAQMFAQTGHFVYNGWAVEILGWQVLWGALFIKLFGFSFTITRLSMLPVVMATIFLLHSILRRFGVTPRNAIFGTLTFGLSPLFLPLAGSFMTDVPGVFVILLCLYLCKRAVDAGTARSTIAWLTLAAASNALGGSVRQIAWLGALVMLPSTGWLLRKRRGVLLASFFLWGISAAAIFLTMQWFSHQPYSLPEPILPPAGLNPIKHSIHLLFQLSGALLCILLMVFPILVAWLTTVRSLNSAALSKLALITATFGVFEWITSWTAPWLYHVLSAEFDPNRNGENGAAMFPGLPKWGRETISLLVVVTALILLRQLRSKLWPQLKSWAKGRTALPSPWQDILWLLGPFTVCYFLLLIPRGYRFVISDTYLLPIIPIAILCLLLLHQRWIAKPIPRISFAVLAIFALLSVAGTHDWFAWYRAKTIAANEILASGVPRTEIQGGWAYDGWTQIEADGYLNDPRLVLPAGAYHPVPNPQPDPNKCGYDFTSYTPAIHPRFSLVFARKMSCLTPSKFPPVHYRTWLPPFSGTIYVQRIPGTATAINGFHPQNPVKPHKPLHS